AALKMYPAEMIQSAEIMYSAPPQYHVRGAAINLVLKGDNYIIFNKATGKKLYIIYNSSKSISVGVLSDNPATQCQWLKSGDWYNIFIIKLKSDKVTSAM
ncbi:MAG: hypothetical protein LBS69_11840, partial [Prevotellaceae bacterium]|nr:hypothetical protein [Prevotellaceae bacterium]